MSAIMRSWLYFFPVVPFAFTWVGRSAGKHMHMVLAWYRVGLPSRLPRGPCVICYRVGRNTAGKARRPETETDPSHFSKCLRDGAARPIAEMARALLLFSVLSAPRAAVNAGGDADDAMFTKQNCDKYNDDTVFTAAVCGQTDKAICFKGTQVVETPCNSTFWCRELCGHNCELWIRVLWLVIE